MWYNAGSYFSGKDIFILKAIGRVISSAILLVLTGLMVAFAKAAPNVVFSFYPALSKSILSAIASVSSLVPIALWEVLTVLLALWFFYTLIRVFTGHRSLLRWLSGVLLGLSTGVFLFVAIWGLGHFGPPVDKSLGLDVREYSKQAPDGYTALARQYDQFTDGLGPVKPLASWRLFSQTGTTGIFICFTAEACVNPDTYTAWIPFTMCHELAHRQAVTAEDDANFCAYLACMASESDDFRYSGAFGAYIYCHNALSKVDKTAASQIWSTLSDGVIADIRAANEHYAQYEGKVQNAAQKVNDTYLKAFSEESGVQSYGEAADLLIAWYLKNNT